METYTDLCRQLSVRTLEKADLRGANLSEADLRRAKLPGFQIPQGGRIYVWGKKAGRLVYGYIPEGARRTACLTSRKCRAERLMVLYIEDREPVIANGTLYREGYPAIPDSYDDDIRIECTHGIHVWLTKAEAVAWG